MFRDGKEYGLFFLERIRAGLDGIVPEAEFNIGFAEYGKACRHLHHAVLHTLRVFSCEFSKVLIPKVIGHAVLNDVRYEFCGVCFQDLIDRINESFTLFEVIKEQSCEHRPCVLHKETVLGIGADNQGLGDFLQGFNEKVIGWTVMKSVISVPANARPVGWIHHQDVFSESLCGLLMQFAFDVDGKDKGIWLVLGEVNKQ